MDVDHIIGDEILSAQSDAIIAADKEGAIIFWNPGAEPIFGFTRAKAIGRSLDIIISTRLRKRYWDGYHGVMESGASRYGQGDVLAVPSTAKDGRQLSLEFTIVPLRDTSRGLIGTCCHHARCDRTVRGDTRTQTQGRGDDQIV